MTDTPELRFIREKDLRPIDGLSVTQRRVLVKAGHYPKPIKLSVRAKAWLRHEIDAWVQGRIAASRTTPKSRA